MPNTFEVEDSSIEIFEMMDLLTFTFSNKFIDKWKYKYSETFVKAFRNRLLESIKKNKILKKSQLENHLINQLKYNPIQVQDFFESIDLGIYYPIIQ